VANRLQWQQSSRIKLKETIIQLVFGGPHARDMGQSLSEPKTEKKTEKFENVQFSVGSSSMQGWRLEMEDAHSVDLGFAQDPDSAYFAVFDGHGGAKFAQLCGSRLSHYVETDPAFKTCGDYSTALSNSFLSIDKDLQEEQELQTELGGTTAIVVLIRDNMIYCANAGDSRAVACVAGRVKELSFDHKPYNKGEQARIFRAGGWVEFNRVNGNLALSRAIGDFNFKRNPDLPQAEQIVTG
jgi:protein phosphatase 2C family protein 2/3